MTLSCILKHTEIVRNICVIKCLVIIINEFIDVLTGHSV